MSTSAYASLAAELPMPRDDDAASLDKRGLASPAYPQKKPTPLSTTQMLIYAGIRGSEPLLFFSIFPFINEALLEYGISTDARTTGYAAGVLESACWLANGLSIGLWIYLADIYGRRPVMLWSTLATALAAGLVGFPKSFVGILFLRVMAGLLNGQAGISKTYLSELADESNQATAFAFQSLAWQTGWCIASIGGGYLSHLERHVPSLSSNAFLRDHPYALATTLMTLPTLVAVFCGYFAMRETLVHHSDSPRFEPGKSQSRLAWTPAMWQALSIFASLCACNVAFQACLPLFFYGPVASGGLGLSTAAIGKWYACRAVLIIASRCQLHRRFGHITLLRGQISLYPIIFLLCPLVSISRRWSGTEELDPFTLLLLAILLLVEATGQTVFISGDLLFTNAAPEKALQSKFNAAIESAAKFATVAATWIASWLFAFSAQTQLLGGYLVWLVACVVSCATCRLIFSYREPEGWRRQAVEPATPMTPFHDHTDHEDA